MSNNNNNIPCDCCGKEVDENELTIHTMGDESWNYCSRCEMAAYPDGRDWDISDEDPDFVNWQHDLRHEDDDHDAEDFPY